MKRAKHTSASAAGRTGLAVSVAICLLTGCQSANHAQRGAVLGSLLGAGTGAIIGNQSGHRDKGALIGALTGAAAGGMLGRNRDLAEERDAAMAYAHHTEAVRRAENRAVTNSDVVNMVANGISDDLIISTIRARGGRFDTSPEAVIQLRNSGVSPTVIRTMQEYDRVR